MKTIITLTIAVAFIFTAGVFAQSGSDDSQAYLAGGCCGQATNATVSADAKAKIKEQTICPIMGNKLTSKKLYVDYKGKRIYVCCPPCIAEVKKNPKKALETIRKNGETAQVIKKK